MGNFKKNISVLLVLLLIGIIFITNKSAKVLNTKPSIAVTTFALYDITKHIAQDSMNVSMIMPIGVDAHTFEPTPKLMVNINKADLVIYSGAGLEPWIHGFEFKKAVINMSKHVKLRKLNHTEVKEDGHENLIDPHYWLDPNNMKIATNVITNALIKISPSNKKLYIKNRDSYLAMLNSLDKDYRKDLSICKLNTIIVNHNAFGYVAQRYGFHVEALTGLTPEAEPSARNMARLIDMIKKDSVSTVFFESFVNNRAMKSIANEAKVAVNVFQPLANVTSDEAKKHSTYESIMKENLYKLSKALKCQ